jgi:hypothetical protein
LIYMRITETGQRSAVGVWPETVTLEPTRLVDDPGSGHRAIHAAVVHSQRLVLSAPVRLGPDPVLDLAVLRFLTEAATEHAELDWTLVGEPPWPVRMLVHLPPPTRGADPIAREYVTGWRKDHHYGLCIYRLGPGFVRVRDIRPGGPHLRVLIDDSWADVFGAVVAEAAEEPDISAGPGRQLLDELEAAGLAVTIGPRTHVLPFRLRRWPIPYTAI